MLAMTLNAYSATFLYIVRHSKGSHFKTKTLRLHIHNVLKRVVLFAGAILSGIQKQWAYSSKQSKQALSVLPIQVGAIGKGSTQKGTPYYLIYTKHVELRRAPSQTSRF